MTDSIYKPFQVMMYAVTEPMDGPANPLGPDTPSEPYEFQPWFPSPIEGIHVSTSDTKKIEELEEKVKKLEKEIEKLELRISVALNEMKLKILDIEK